MLLWKKGEEIITVNTQIIGKPDRFRLEQVSNGNNLVIALAETEDAGNYTCQISTYKPTEIVHEVRIRGERGFFWDVTFEKSSFH